MLTAKNMHTSS